MEPKLRARRIEVARDQGRKRLRRVLVLVAVLVVGGLAFAATRSPLLDVDRVQVRGAGAQTQAVREALGIEEGRPMASVDEGAAVARLEALPLVEEASVARSWPSTIEVQVQLRHAVAAVGSGPGSLAVAADGTVLGAASPADELPTIDGAPAAVGEPIGPERRRLTAVLGELPASLRSEIAAATIGGGVIELELVDGIEVRWGDDRQSVAKGDALAALLAQADRPTIASIDVSVPHAATLNRETGGDG